MIDILNRSIELKDKTIWNDWREVKKREIIVVTQSELDQLKVTLVPDYDFSDIVFDHCVFDQHFEGCSFEDAKFDNCSFVSGLFAESNFQSATFDHVTFEQTNLSYSNFNTCTFKDCTFFHVDLIFSSIVKSTFLNCTLRQLYIYGANIWDIDIDKHTTQNDIIIPYKQFKGRDSETLIIDDIQVANIIYLLLDNSNYTRLLDQSRKKSVLLLGRFAGELKDHIEELKHQVRNNGLSPIVFDFEKPDTLDLIEAIVLLSLLSKFIIVDLTDTKSVPAELQAILSTVSIPVVPIIKSGFDVFSTYTFTNKYRCVLPILRFDKIQDLSGDVFRNAVMKPVDDLSNEVNQIKQRDAVFRDVNDTKE